MCIVDQFQLFVVEIEVGKIVNANSSEELSSSILVCFFMYNMDSFSLGLELFCCS